MKKLISALTTLTIAVGSLGIAPLNVNAEGAVYEFENGKIVSGGENETAVISLAGASGGKVVDLKDSGDSVTINVNAKKSGVQTLSIRYSQPYDESGKYQNVIVNGKNIGQIFCSYTGEGKFRTVNISADLKTGDNSITVESSWGWTYLDCLTIGESSVSSGANPIISRNAPAYSGKSNNASSGNDDKYYTFWTAAPEDYLAYDLSAVPESQRKKVIAVWYNTSTYDNIGIYVNKDNEPVDYTIEVNKAAGGSYPSSGWETAETVKGNGYSSRQHVVDMDGYNWIRMRVTKSNGSNVSLNFDIHDASKGVTDSWIFFGDSITAGSMVNAYGTGFASFVNQLDSNFFPVQENGGIGGITSNDGKNNIDKWLSTSPAKYVSIAYGTNDAWGNPNNAQRYYENTKYMIDAILNAGKVPVLPKIPFATNSDVGSNTGYYNAMIDKLYSEYGDKLVHGPDFDEFFRSNTWGLSEDGVHPNSDGYEAMRKLWAETMYENVYKNMADGTDTPDDDFVKGDVNGNGKFNVADLVLFQKWLLADPNASLSNWKAGDLCEDGRLDSFDLVLMRNLLIQQEQTPTVSPSVTPSRTPAEYMNNIRSSIVDSLPCGAADAVGGVDYGEMRSCTYYSTTRERMTPVRVLLPAGYNENEKYPVLYMLHGYWNDETTLSDPDSGLQNIVGNLIAKGEAEKMIVVFPYIYTSKDMPFCTGMDDINNQNYDNFIYDLNTDLMPWIESNFSVKTGRENTAISGFSMGARESLYIGVKMCGKIGYVGSVCTAPGLAPGMLRTDEMRFDNMPYMVLISGAVFDGVVGNNPENYHNMLTANGVEHIWNSLPYGGHDNNSIQPHFYNFVKNIFKA